MRSPLRVAYILHRFPYLTETFILREMRRLEHEAVQVDVYSLLPPKAGVVHKDARKLLERTRYAPLFSGTIARAQAHYLLRAPLRYLRALLKTVWQSYPEPRVMLLMLALFPKCVYFARAMEREGVQHVHAHFVWLEGIAAGIVAELTGLPFTITPHAFGLYTRRRACVARELESASRIVTISEANRRFIAGLTPRLARAAIDVVHCGVDTALWKPPAQRPDAYPVRLLSIGRAVEKKGHDDLVAACALLAERSVPFECRILAGGGAGAAALDAAIDARGLRGRVSLLEPRDEDGIRELFYASEVFVLAAKTARNGDRDGIPVVLMEAMACGLPVVSTNVSGIPELVEHQGSGLLVPPGDPAALASALQTLIEDAALRRGMGAQGRERVVAEFRIEHTAARMATVFRETTRAARPARVTELSRVGAGR